MKAVFFLSVFLSAPAYAADGVHVPEFPCSSFAECSGCTKRVDGFLGYDKRRNNAAFLSKCQAECGRSCLREPVPGQPAAEGRNER